MFRNTSKTKAFWMAVVCGLIAWGGWQVANATPGWQSHLVCAGPFIFFTLMYILVLLSKLGRDKKLAHQPEDNGYSQVMNRAYQNSTSRYYIPQDDE